MTSAIHSDTTHAGQAPAALLRTPLFALHVELGARMVPFAGYEMPVQFPPGILKEHLHTRAAAGLFDVSHMGQVALRPRSGVLRDAALALETLVPNDVLGLAVPYPCFSPFITKHRYLQKHLVIL